MKLRTVRFSGLPVSKANLEAYDAEFKAAYDQISAEHGQDMLKMHEEILKVESALQAKYTQIEKFQMPTSAKQWKAIIDACEAPIMIARSLDNPNEIVLVIMDRPLA